jgi:CheY-like chemotaxis protein/HPt (histidine-containing phosphotransfer) domain-containing protein
VESVFNQGTTFWFAIPFEKINALSKHQKFSKPEMGAMVHLKEFNHQVLVVDDNSVNQLIAVKMLEKLGFKACSVSNGREAIDLLSKVSYGAVLMDCRMPVMDGFEATAQIRKMEEGKTSTPVIALTAYTSEETQRKCLEVGMNDYISKPIKLDELAAVMNRWVAQNVSNETILSFKGIDSEETSDETILNLRLLLKLKDQVKKDNQDDIVEELIDTFLDFTPMRISLLREVVSQNNEDLSEHLAHTLKAACATVGALKMTKLCKKLEVVNRSASEQERSNLVVAIGDEFLKVKEKLLEFKNG